MTVWIVYVPFSLTIQLPTFYAFICLPNGNQNR